MDVTWWVVVLLVVAPLALAALLRRVRRPPRLALGDAPHLRAPARRTALVGAALTVLGAALIAGTALSARPADALADLVPEGKSTVLVLDVSASIGDIVYQEIANTLRGVIDTAGTSGRIGLVLFSDAALEALPPGTRAIELEPFIRYFEPLRDRGLRPRPQPYRAALPGSPAPTRYPINPWLGFSGGTQISTGLAAARAALERDAGGRGRVLLVSDLQEADEDRAALTQELLSFAKQPAIDLRVVALPPATDVELDLFRRTLGRGESVVGSFELDRRSRSQPTVSMGFPWQIVGLVAALGVAVAAYALLVSPLRWRSERVGT